MDINFLGGFYVNSRLYQICVDLNISKQYYKRLKQLLQIKKVENTSLIRIGQQEFDGGYLMIDDVVSSGKVAYSFGIYNDVSWDYNMAKFGYDVYMYDHTIEKLPYDIPKFHFFKAGISGKNDAENCLNTLKHYLSKNGHSKAKNMILKMDVEGAEWDFLETVELNTLKRFDQIVLELHNVIKSGYGKRILKLLSKLNKTHQLVHLHGNNCGYVIKIGDKVFPDVLEATYVLKDRYNFMEDSEIMLPLPMDIANDRARSDIVLGKWNESL